MPSYGGLYACLLTLTLIRDFEGQAHDQYPQTPFPASTHTHTYTIMSFQEEVNKQTFINRVSLMYYHMIH